jgi:hypothetical protein
MVQVQVAVGWETAQMEARPVFKVADIPMEVRLRRQQHQMLAGESVALVDLAVVERLTVELVVEAVDTQVAVVVVVRAIGVQVVVVDRFLPRVQRRPLQLRDTKLETVSSQFNTSMRRLQ